VDLAVHASGSTFIGSALNELQDDGISNLADDPAVGFEWRDLASDGLARRPEPV